MKDWETKRLRDEETYRRRPRLALKAVHEALPAPFEGRVNECVAGGEAFPQPRRVPWLVQHLHHLPGRFPKRAAALGERGLSRNREKRRETERNRETAKQRHTSRLELSRVCTYVCIGSYLKNNTAWYYRFGSLILKRLSFFIFLYQAHLVNGLGSRTSLAKSGTGIPAPVVSTCVMPFDRSPSRFRAAAREPMNSPGGCTGTGRPSG